MVLCLVATLWKFLTGKHGSHLWEAKNSAGVHGYSIRVASQDRASNKPVSSQYFALRDSSWSLTSRQPGLPRCPMVLHRTAHCCSWRSDGLQIRISSTS